jgi:hypothetical protein
MAQKVNCRVQPCDDCKPYGKTRQTDRRPAKYPDLDTLENVRRRLAGSPEFGKS